LVPVLSLPTLVRFEVNRPDKIRRRKIAVRISMSALRRDNLESKWKHHEFAPIRRLIGSRIAVTKNR
jgi:hypothetical protein